MPRWFLLLNGVALLLMGGLLLYGRLREGRRSLLAPAKFIGLIWALLCCAMGLGLLLMAYGHITQPGSQTGPPVPRTLEFPTGR